MKNENPLPHLPGEPMEEKPMDREISRAAERLYDKWGIYSDSTSGFYTNFYYSEVTGIGKEEGVTRRDPTSVLRIDGMYYVWYTRRQTAKARDYTNRPPFRDPQIRDIPVFDWDLSEIWYATSEDGFNWQERGKAVGLGPRGEYDCRSVFTPDVLLAGEKLYLYYQAVDYPYTIRTTNAIGMSWSESPHGPWNRWDTPVLTPGKPGEWLGDDDSNAVCKYGDWDSHKVHDPFIMKRKDEYWLYYKGQPMGWGTEHCTGIGLGVAIAEKPEGPFAKSPLNPVTNSGHETCLYPYKEGVAAICGHDGPEKDTIQFAPDGLNFEVVSHVFLPPCAAGPFAPDSYVGTDDGKGINWGLAHIATEETGGLNSYILRFDCNLHRDVERPGFRVSNIRYPESVYFSRDKRMTDRIRVLKPFENEAVRDIDVPTVTGALDPVTAEERVSRIFDEPVSEATRRVRDIYGVHKDLKSEFFSAFKYSEISGLGKEPGVTRRDPSKVILVNGMYHVWYTRRSGTPAPGGFDHASDTVPVFDWDLAEIWHAVSGDGLHWEEQGPAVRRGAAGSFDDRSVLTPDILVFEGKYYLYYQVLQSPYRRKSVYQIGMSRADSLEGPWHRYPEVIIPIGNPPHFADESDNPDAVSSFGAWDSHKIHDPSVIVRNGQIWIYYKGVGYGRHYRNDLGCAWGVAMADDPQGPFKKSPLNPITNSGHETFLFPYREGVMAVTGLEGPEKNTIQYAPDGLNFEVMGKVSLPPVAAGPYVPDAFDDSGDGLGVTWGLSHIFHGDDGLLENSYLVRFDCSLSREYTRPGFFRRWNFRFPESAYFSRQFRLSEKMKKEALELGRKLDEDTI